MMLKTRIVLCLAKYLKKYNQWISKLENVTMKSKMLRSQTSLAGSDG
jgi:hypothetical protein